MAMNVSNYDPEWQCRSNPGRHLVGSERPYAGDITRPVGGGDGGW
jgi:hypothetical protein